MNSLKNLSKEDKYDLVGTKAAQDKLIDFAVVVDRNYKVNWHHRLIAGKLQEAYEKVKRGEKSQIMFFFPPRHGKSNLVSIKYPAWVLGKDPSIPIIVTSYSQELATDFGLAARDLVNSENYQAIFDTRLRADTKAKGKWLTKQGGGYTATGMGGAITGKGWGIGIVDDPVKNMEEAESEVIKEKHFKWWQSVFLTREEGIGAKLLMMTRWFDDDLAGRIIKHAKDNNKLDEWDIVSFPAVAEKDEEFRKEGEALWPYRFPLSILNGTKIDVGPYVWSALYQQDPVDEESREFKKAWFHPRPFEEVLKLDTRRFITVDPADALTDKSDFIGICINYVDTDNNWNLRTMRLKVNSRELINLFFKLYEEVSFEKIGIEQGTYRNAIKPFLDEEMKKRGIFFQVEELLHKQTEKHIRIRGLIPRYSAGSIFHIEKECSDLEDELARFPKGAHEDVLDSTAYQLQIAESPIGNLAEMQRIERRRRERRNNELL